jgi:putative FmdB family regulatory protein
MAPYVRLRLPLRDFRLNQVARLVRAKFFSGITETRLPHDGLQRLRELALHLGMTGTRVSPGGGTAASVENHQRERFMVFYQYLCHTHGAFNITRRLGKAPSQAPCPSCGSQARRMLSAPTVLNGRRSSLFSAMDRAEKSRHEPEVVTSLPPSGVRRPQVRMTPELRRLPRP